jgi:hypothetical protein
MLQGGIDALAADMAMEEVSDLFPGEALGGIIEGLADAVGGGFAGEFAEEEAGGGRAVPPYCERGLEMRGQ